MEYLGKNREGIEASSVLEQFQQQLRPLLPLIHAHELRPRSERDKTKQQKRERLHYHCQPRAKGARHLDVSIAIGQGQDGIN